MVREAAQRMLAAAQYRRPAPGGWQWSVAGTDGADDDRHGDGTLTMCA